MNSFRAMLGLLAFILISQHVKAKANETNTSNEDRVCYVQHDKNLGNSLYWNSSKKCSGDDVGAFFDKGFIFFSAQKEYVRNELEGDGLLNIHSLTSPTEHIQIFDNFSEKKEYCLATFVFRKIVSNETQYDIKFNCTSAAVGMELEESFPKNKKLEWFYSTLAEEHNFDFLFNVGQRPLFIR